MAQGRRSGRALVAATALMSLVAALLVSTGGTVPAEAAEVPGDQTEGRLLAVPRMPVHPSFGVRGLGSDYLSVEDGTGDHVSSVFRISDGTKVSGLTEQDIADDHRMVVVERGSQAKVEVRDVDTNELLWSPTLMPEDWVVAATSEWVLVQKEYAKPNPLELIRPDGSRAHVDYPASASPQFWTTSVVDRWGAVLQSHYEDKTYLFDAVTGSVRELVASSLLPWFDLTPHRVFAISNRDDPRKYDITWWDRDGSGTGRVVSSPEPGTVGPFVAVGDQPALLHRPEFASTPGSELRPVDLATGSLGEALASQVSSAAELDDGRAVLGVIDGPTGGVEVISAQGEFERTVMTLPPAPRPVFGAWLDGDTVTATYVDDFTSRADVTNQDGSAPWISAGSALGTPLSGDVLAVDSGTYLTSLGRSDAGDTYQVTWPGGQRTESLRDATPMLGRGARLLALVFRSGAHHIADARTGTRLESTSSDNYALNGWWFWKVWDDGTLRGTDLSGKQPDRVVHSGVAFDGLRITSVFGQWALLKAGSTTFAVDLAGAQQPYPIPGGAYSEDPVLGNGVVAVRRWSSTGTDQVDVYDLSPAHAQRSYAFRMNGYRARHPVALDTAGARRLAYIDGENRIRIADLDWLQTPTTSSTWYAPRLVSLSGTPRLATTRRVTASWTFVDSDEEADRTPTGVASYDIRYQQAAQGMGFGTWIAPTAWQRTTLTSVGLDGVSGQTTCFQVRARDKAGHLGAWSASRCSTVDLPPRIVSAAAKASVVASVRTSRATFTWSGKDDVSTPRYDVQSRVAWPGEPYEPWGTVLSASSRTSTTVVVEPGGEACLRVRATDSVGNKSAWAYTACTAVPVDDSAMRATDSDTRRASSTALGGGYARLTKGKALSLRGQSGRGVWVRAKYGSGCCGVVEVRVDGHLLGRIKRSSRTSWLWLKVSQSTTFSHDTITVKSVGTRPVLIDAIAIRR